MKIKYLFVFLVLMMIVFFSGCVFLPYGNEAPEIISTPLSSVKIEQAYVYNVKAKDTENDVLSYSLLEFPAGMTIDTLTGMIKWTPTSEQIGKNEIIVNAEDKWRNDTQSFAIVVSDILLKSIDVIPTSMTLMETYSNLLDEKYLLVTAHYDYGPPKSVALSECEYESSNVNAVFVGRNGIISATSKGFSVITVSYTENNITKSDTVDVIVTPFIAGDN